MADACQAAQTPQAAASARLRIPTHPMKLLPNPDTSWRIKPEQFLRSPACTTASHTCRAAGIKPRTLAATITPSVPRVGMPWFFRQLGQQGQAADLGQQNERRGIESPQPARCAKPKTPFQADLTRLACSLLHYRRSQFVLSQPRSIRARQESG